MSGEGGQSINNLVEFRFWPKTMDYNKAFLPKSRCFSAVLLLHSGRCYEAEICVILFLLRCPFIWGHYAPFDVPFPGSRLTQNDLHYKLYVPLWLCSWVGGVERVRGEGVRAAAAAPCRGQSTRHLLP